MDIELKDQIKEVLVDGLGYMNAISGNFTILIDAIASGNQASITKNYEDLREGLQWIVDALDNFEILLELDFSIILIGKQSSKSIIENYKNFISEWEVLYNRGDYEKLSEMTELQLSKHMKKLIMTFNKITAKVKEKEN